MNEHQKYIIKDILSEIVEPLRGLTLISNPAGSGKSFETSIFIADLIGKTDRKIYYITPRLDNVNELYDDLLLAIGDDDHKREKVLKIESYRHAVLKGLSYVKDNKVINQWKETQELLTRLNHYQNTTDKNYKRELEQIIFYDVGNFEYRFRKRLSYEFRKAYKKQNNKYKNAYDYMQHSEWKFIEKIYPSAALNQKQVFVLSSAKFFGRNDPIIKLPYNFTDEYVIKDAIVIIDEFDAIKRDLLCRLAEDNLQMNYVRLFKEIYYCLQDMESIDENTLNLGDGNCRKQLDVLKLESEELHQKYFPKTKNMKLLVRDEDRDTLKRIENNDQILTYRGVQAHPTMNRQTYFYLPCNEENNYHLERATDETCNLVLMSSEVNFKQDDYYPIWLMVNEIRKFVIKSLRSFYYTAEDYQKEKNHYYTLMGNNEENLVSLNNAISTVISNLNFSDSNENLDRYTKYVLSVTEPNMYHSSKKEKASRDHSIYSKGLYYCCDYESERTRDNSQICIYQLFNTPELMMLNLCTNAHVIGISATAEVPSVDNFNLEYLDQELEKRGLDIYPLTAEQQERLKADYQSKSSGYQDYQIETKIIKIAVEDHNRVDVRSDLAWLCDENRVEELQNKICYEKEYADANRRCKQLEASVRQHPYDYQRLVKQWRLMKSVMQNYKNDQVISNCLLFSNKGLQIGEREVYTLENMKLGAVFAYMSITDANYQEATQAVDKIIYSMNAEKLKSYKTLDANTSGEIIEELSTIQNAFTNNTLMFLVTTYNSVSRGNNPQVEVDTKEIKKRLNEERLYEINEIFKKYTHMDWDAIYIEKPSYVIPNIQELFARGQSAETLESLFIVEDICHREKFRMPTKHRILKDFFMKVYDDKTIAAYNLLYACPSVKNAYTTRIYQTIGRMSRTNLKKKYNAIYYDADLIDVIEADCKKLNLAYTTNEFEKFRLELKKEQYLKELRFKQNVFEAFSKQNQRCRQVIEGIFPEIGEKGWDKDTMAFWEQLREVLLQYPTGMTAKQIAKTSKQFDKFNCVQRWGFDFKDIFLEFPQAKNHYFFNIGRDEDKDMIYVSKDNQKNSKQSVDYPYEVSIESSRLSYFSNNEYVQEYFSEKGYSLDWDKKSKYMMCPYIYHNIYKGAVGEEILKAIFTKKFNYQVYPITDEEAFEKFDFIVKTSKGKVFVDAKNFGAASMVKEFANEELLLKLKRKVADLDIKKAFIINLIDQLGDRHSLNRLNFTIVQGIYTFVNDYQVNPKQSPQNEGLTEMDVIRNIIEEIEVDKHVE
ncbi:hypothetical protein SAMN05421767_1432 [Granulicatella balaenopterae]|uniref:Uncharacterized protein n=1 Tax=Granulicatella balaenopterae TaxID=137733 RepID=A0A1H9NNQ1_9LACT|nr:hypothetical protein [Granulicatella balaenopterae]SER37576.1 hypothetical protein SAMN05421767_1432 [Granulicatella balaenopterae]